MTIPSRLVAFLVLFMVAALALSACGNSPTPSPSPTIHSGVQGVSLIVGGPAPGDPRPEPGTRVAVHRGSLDGPLVTQTRADAHGKFSVTLEPGRYTLVQISDAAMPKSVTVSPNEYASVKLYIEAK